MIEEGVVLGWRGFMSGSRVILVGVVAVAWEKGAGEFGWEDCPGCRWGDGAALMDLRAMCWAYGAREGVPEGVIMGLIACGFTSGGPGDWPGGG